MSVVVGLDYERLTVHCFTGEPTSGWRDLSVIFGHDYETARCSDRDSIHAWRDTSVKKPPVLIVTHGAPFIRRSDSRLAHYELQEPAPFDGSPGDLFDRRALRLAGYERQ